MINKILIILIFVVLIICGGYLGLFFSLDKHFSYSDADLDKNNILTLSELDYFSNIGFKYKCLLDKSDNNSSACKALEIEIFSLKDGLAIKKEEKADGCCVFSSDKKPFYQTTNEVIYWDDKIEKPLVSKSWHNKQIVVGLKANDSKYFLIDKKQMKLYDGLNKKDFLIFLKQYNVDFNKKALDINE